MLSLFDAILVVGYFIIIFGKGIWMRRPDKGGAHFWLGGRALTLPAFVVTTVTTWYGGILGVGEYSFRYGISNWIVFGVPYYFGAILFALLISKRARRGETLTLPHRLERTYGLAAGKISAVFILMTTLPAAYVLIMGTLFSLGFGMLPIVGILLSVCFAVVYMWRGGFSAIVRIDALQFGIMFGSFFLLSIYLLWTYGSTPLASLDARYFSLTGGLPWASILIWYVIALSTLAEPNFFQRAFAAKTPAVAKRGLLISVFFWCFFDAMTTLCGLYARALLPDLDNPLHAFPALGAYVLPVGLLGLFFVGLFATVLSTLDSNLFTLATTFARDLWPRRGSERLSVEFRTRVGLILGAAGASAVAAFSDSVVSLWKIFGSVSAATLLVPILSTYYGPLRMSSRGVCVLMVSSAIITLGWFAAGRIMGGVPFGIEPLFVGLGCALVCFGADRGLAAIKARRQGVANKVQ